MNTDCKLYHWSIDTAPVPSDNLISLRYTHWFAWFSREEEIYDSINKTRLYADWAHHYDIRYEHSLVLLKFRVDGGEPQQRGQWTQERDPANTQEDAPQWD